MNKTQTINEWFPVQGSTFKVKNLKPKIKTFEPLNL